MSKPRDQLENGDAVFFDLTLDRRQLLTEYPPSFQHPYKRMLFDMSRLADKLSDSGLRVLRYRPRQPAVGSAEGRTRALAEQGFYRYEASTGADDAGAQWYVNFADGDLFVAYGSHLFAQDEMQVAEHPLLGSLRESLFDRSLQDSDYDPCTRDDDEKPSPILVQGVERCLHVDTSPNVARGCPDGLYGNRFAQADETVIREATRLIDPPTLTNLIAMEAPKPGRGQYQPDTIADILATAYTAFSAAVSLDGDQSTVIHTGNWGCGAYGGNRKLMYAAQLVMADWAGVAELRFYDVDQAALAVAQELRERMDQECQSISDCEAFLSAQGYEWGMSDGN